MKKLIFLFLLIIIAAWIFFVRRGEPGINQMQIIGSHNSYKEYIDTSLFLLIKKDDSNAVAGMEYSHNSLSEQLNLGLRALEIDVYADLKGGRYAQPGGLAWAGTNLLRPFDPEKLMNEPGFKVLHVQDIDFRTNCLTLKICLQELKTWSDNHPGHDPVFITLNAKDDTIQKPGFTIPEQYTAEILNELDKEIAVNMGLKKLIIPDMVRGKFETLEKAVLNNNWPKLKKAKDKFIFILDEQGDKLAYYVKDHRALTKRMLFANAPPGSPEAAIIILNDPVTDLDKIRELVKKGYIVRTRADADTKEARTNDKSRFMAACKSGAQIISTDYYTRTRLFKTDYMVSFDGGKYCRENPVLH